MSFIRYVPDDSIIIIYAREMVASLAIFAALGRRIGRQAY